MIREDYKRMMAQISPDSSMCEKMIQLSQDVQAEEKTGRRSWVKAAATAAALIFCFIAAVPVLAATVDPVYDIVYEVSPVLAQLFTPVRLSDEDNGIRMEVESARIIGNRAEIYVSMKDLTGDRIDESTDLFDSYSINRPFDSIGTCSMVDYDSETDTARFLIEIVEWGDRDISKDKITFTVGNFISHKAEYDNIELPISTDDVLMTPQTQQVRFTGYSWVSEERPEEESTALKTDQSQWKPIVDGMELCGAGYIDGKLHIQTAVRDGLRNDNHGTVYLVDKDGNYAELYLSASFANRYDNSPDRIDYCEYIYDIPQNELANYTMYADCVITGMYVEGDWKVTFRLDEASN